MSDAFDNLGRDRFTSELADPSVRDRLIAYTQAEVGGQGERARQAFMESIFNRAVARGQTLRQTLSGSYFPGVTHQRASQPVSGYTREDYNPLISSVLSGSNITNYATGNASGTVGFAGGPQTYAAGGERFGIEGPDKGWWTRIGAAGPVGSGVGYISAQPQSLADLQSVARAPSGRAAWGGFSPFVDWAAKGGFPTLGG